MEIENHKNLWAAEYNPLDENFHIQPLTKTIEGNRRCSLEGRAHDYLLVGVFDTPDEASLCCDDLTKFLRLKN